MAIPGCGFLHYFVEDYSYDDYFIDTAKIIKTEYLRLVLEIRRHRRDSLLYIDKVIDSKKRPKPFWLHSSPEIYKSIVYRNINEFLKDTKKFNVTRDKINIDIKLLLNRSSDDWIRRQRNRKENNLSSLYQPTSNGYRPKTRYTILK